MADILQVRSIETLTRVEASVNEFGGDYVNGNTDKVVKFELWLDASELSTVATGANEIFDGSFNIEWDGDANIPGLDWLITGDQQAADTSIINYNYNNQNNLEFAWNPANATLAFSKATASVDTKSPPFGVDQIPSEKLIATFYTNPLPNTEDSISLKLRNINIGTNLADSLDLADVNIIQGAVVSNNAPTLVSAIVDASSDEGAAYSYDTSGHFNDVDNGDSLIYTATLSNDSALPNWLSIDQSTGVISGTPSASHTGNFDIKVSATDSQSESINDTYTLTINSSGSNIIDTSGDDVITGTASADTIIAGIGLDVINAAAGDDVINLTGNSAYTGLFAHNVGSSSDVATNIKLDLTGKVKLETVVDGGADADTVNLSANGDAFFLHDSFSGFHSTVSLTADTHTGADSAQRILNVETINGLGGDDIIDLTSPDYSLAGQVITIDGGAGNDVIWGSDATETLIGGDGNDILFGGSGNDTLTGGSGADTFEFTVTAGSDTITDFQTGSDNIKIYSNNIFNVNKTSSTNSDYIIDGVADPTLYLVRGETYIFEMSGTGHPFYIKSSGTSSGTDDEYSTGVSRTGSVDSGSDGDELEFTPTGATPDTLWYQCSVHSDMLGEINIVDTFAETLQSDGNNLIWNTLTIQSNAAVDVTDVAFVEIV